MKQLFKTAALVAATTLACASAHALTVNWGAHPTAIARSVTPGAASFFDDTFSFSVASAGTLGAVVVANNLNAGGADVYLVIGGVFGLYRNPDGVIGNADDTAVGPGLLAFDERSGGNANVNLVSAGNYYYRVLGLAAGSAGAAYQITSSFAAAVPEPGSWALMLAGLGGAGFAARRRLRRG